MLPSTQTTRDDLTRWYGRSPVPNTQLKHNLMVKRIVLGLLGAALLAGTTYLGIHRAGVVPPLGPILDPANGVWALARSARPMPLGTIRSQIFSAPVEVTIDDRGVPHIFAKAEMDAFRALGFLVARDRLFQLEIQTRAAAGTLTELVGPNALPLDRQARKFGFGQMLARVKARRDTTTEGYRSIVAYGEGVNAYLDQLRPADVPLEYRLLGARPARWTADQTDALLARMAVTLAFNDPSLLKAQAAAKIGWPAAEALFPNNSSIQDPIQPNLGDSTRHAYSPVPPPGPGDHQAQLVAPILRSLAATGTARTAAAMADAVGSNNWAVGPSRTVNKVALLAGDPHLELTLPSIWYQAHLVVPDQLDVAGITLPGAPWVIIGFNRALAWSFTNVGSDVTDFYRETVDDRANPTQYQLDGAWQPLEQRIERYRGPAGEVLGVDTVRFTHRGPLWQADSSWLSLAWTAYDLTDPGKEFLAINRARTAGEFLEGSATYGGPAQNMLVADRRGTIAIRSTGRYPTRPDDGRGDLIKDGSRSATDWNGSLAPDAYPFSINPTRGFLSSTNQQPVDPAVNPRYLGGVWENPWRAIRINTLLRADSQMTLDKMRRFQADSVSERARAFLPLLLNKTADSIRRRKVAPSVRAARDLLASWDGSSGRDDQHPVLFEAVMQELARLTWDELDSAGELVPGETVLLNLMQDTSNVWWDNRSTVGIEHRDDLIEMALAAALDSTTRRYGEPGPQWRWGAVHRVNIPHLLRLPALSALNLEVGGGRGTLWPSGEGGFGPSWRMVVELSNPLQAWATYPGGQSGNIASRHYRDFLPKWLAGELDSLVVPSGPEALPPERVESRLTFTRGGR